MSEHEIRRAIRLIWADLDQRTRAAMRNVVLPAVVGTGIAVAGCDSESPTGEEDVGVGIEDARVVTSDTGDVTGDGDVVDEGLMPLYAAPDLGIDADVPPEDLGPEPLYAAPDMEVDADVPPEDMGPQPEYMAPDADVPEDMGPVPPYMAPDVDAAGLLYAAPDVDAGDMPLYAAPDVDAGPMPEYAAPLYAAPDPGGD